MFIEKNKILKFVKNIYRKLKLKFFQKTNTKAYETFNILADDGDSIHTPFSEEGLAIVEKGQVFVSEDKIEEIVQRELDKRLGVLQQEK